VSVPFSKASGFEVCEILDIKHHTPGNNPKDYTQHLEHGESWKSRNCVKYVNLKQKEEKTNNK
jgi:hypothetical protein